LGFRIRTSQAPQRWFWRWRISRILSGEHVRE
jgi:hypothetical protein